MALSGHGTLVARAPALTPTVFTTIAELRDITPPVLSRNVFDATTQTLNIDTFVVGVLRRSVFNLVVNFLDLDSTQNEISGLLYAMVTQPPPTDGYKITSPDGVAWVVSGQVSSFAPVMPVDGLMSATIGIRPSGRMTINGIVIG